METIEFVLILISFFLLCCLIINFDKFLKKLGQNGTYSWHLLYICALPLFAGSFFSSGGIVFRTFSVFLIVISAVALIYIAKLHLKKYKHGYFSKQTINPSLYLFGALTVLVSTYSFGWFLTAMPGDSLPILGVIVIIITSIATLAMLIIGLLKVKIW